MPERWLILADDLTGAADCAIAFAQRGLAASVVWGTGTAGDAVLAVNADSRCLAPAAAAARHRMLLDIHRNAGPGSPQRTGLFKKIDSTLRGQPAAELAETIRVLREHGHRALSVVAPAFPAAGRTTEGGRIRLHGQALEDASLWQRDHSYSGADLVAVLEGAGLRVRLAALHAVRAEPGALAQLIRDALTTGWDAVVCDAVVAADLDIVARATLPLAHEVFWTGSGGLAQALARSLARSLAQALARTGTAGSVPGVERWTEHRAEHGTVTGGILLIVGSLAEASRAASAVLAADDAVLAVAVAPAVLRNGPDGAEWQACAREVSAALSCGKDVLVQIAETSNADLSQGAALARLLAMLLRPAAAHAGALVATGGETALAVLDAFGVDGIGLIDEIEPGVPLGRTRGALAVPIITKAGAFGDAGTLGRCLSHLRRLRQTETPP